MVTLIITEKPSSSQKIAEALAEGKIEKKNNFGVNYYIIKRGGKEMLIAPAVGHLFILTEEKKGKGWTYPVFDVGWKPVFEIRNHGWAKKYVSNFKKIAKGVKEIYSACDYDIEGSVIAFNIIRFILGEKDGKRMKFSTLTKPDLIEAYEKASDHLDFGMIEAGIARHYLDFYWGINTTRALTLALKHSGSFKILSTGRVQGPTLNILHQRQREINSFKPVSYWEIQLDFIIDGKEVQAFHQTGRFWKKPEVDKVFSKCNGKNGIVESVEKKEHKQEPPHPFDITTLQREVYQHFKYSPKQTLDIAQSLYEQALISYPRTSSQKLPATLGYKEIIQKLQKQKAYSLLCSSLLKGKLKPNEGPKNDPAHPAIFPTGTMPNELSPYQRKVYDLITKRFLAVFAEAAIREKIKAIIDINGEKFDADGIRTIKANWIDFYKPYAKFKEALLPPIKKDDVANSKKLEVLDKETSPPPRYTQATILREMEKLGLGTKATRAGILHTLYDRGYIEEKSIEVTKLGEVVIDALQKYCNDIISVDLTREFEEDMEAIELGKKKKKDIVEQAEKTLNSVLGSFKTNEKKIGEELLEGLMEFRKEETTIGPCKCGGTHVVRRSRFGKRFVGCTGYPKCRDTFSLPHTGFIKILDDKCDCGFFIVNVKPKGKRPWKLCVRCGFKNKFKPSEESQSTATLKKTKTKPAKSPVKKVTKTAKPPVPPATASKKPKAPSTIPKTQPKLRSKK